jgi:hypothetical protein
MSTPRLHALDNLRGVMMWLGIVFHVSLLHATYPTAPVTLRDTQTSLGADVLVGFIHVFRMPVFFVLAGFFVLFLTQQRGLSHMLRNRFQRIALPFAVFWLLIFPPTVCIYVAYLFRMSHGAWGIDFEFLHNAATPTKPLGIEAIHMWFLWMLAWLCLLGAGVLKVVQSLDGKHLNWVNRLLETLVTKAYAPLLLAIPLVLTDANYFMGVLETNTSFLPPLAQWFHYGLYFFWGMALYVHRDKAFALFVQRRHSTGCLALLCFITYLGLAHTHNQHPEAIAYANVWLAFFYNLSSWCMCWAWLGWFTYLFDREIPFLRYLSQSSYWVYLVHFPITLLVGAVLYQWDAAPVFKILVNVVFTTLVCVASYQAFVRRSFISVFLNGKKYS